MHQYCLTSISLIVYLIILLGPDIVQMFCYWCDGNIKQRSHRIAHACVKDNLLIKNNVSFPVFLCLRHSFAISVLFK